ncbi:hypothetical protein BDV38DRAFT_254298 [Aspergillus pseudotamarii]|uniref:Uncharacterized protein n=1 Tax=Aspergillus pseudotamarii TaxID=132259 RepID=A0A5N6SLM9_ASPPS|nr:uncharacterized protein BDV38DRAFT_254298 [Aspergillus pseudotamarii]KAE8134807.1 hypothetical protein BDV38DRAFT_254298 [Aspergillus pseudotamarii]
MIFPCESRRGCREGFSFIVAVIEAFVVCWVEWHCWLCERIHGWYYFSLSSF